MAEYEVFSDGRLVEQYDINSGLHTIYNPDGSPAATRQMTTGEVADLTEIAAEHVRVGNRGTIVQQAQGALASNAAYIALASPTNAQVAAQVKALTRQNNKIIRLLLSQIGDRSQLDATD